MAISAHHGAAKSNEYGGGTLQTSSKERKLLEGTDLPFLEMEGVALPVWLAAPDEELNELITKGSERLRLCIHKDVLLHFLKNQLGENGILVPIMSLNQSDLLQFLT
ncbi:hypothetical protein AVEN_54550-1 [Araneus ventricosus]|uniref:Uncharacterized protein n=1 Tax=Araneus ventricosus TaxID=182803 RepID=A0A4Y2BN82_ARAVE|nr:hypothetical protein AVEN_54550-1 [Araneus ventricosus]